MEENVNTSEVVLPGRRRKWLFGTAMISYCIAELFGILKGIHPTSIFGIAAFMTAISSGAALERYMMLFRGTWNWPDNEMDPFNRSLVYGLAYAVPPMFAMLSSRLGWWTICLSLLLFATLIVRIVLISSRRQVSP